MWKNTELSYEEMTKIKRFAATTNKYFRNPDKIIAQKNKNNKNYSSVFLISSENDFSTSKSLLCCSSVPISLLDFPLNLRCLFSSCFCRRISSLRLLSLLKPPPCLANVASSMSTTGFDDYRASDSE